MSWTEFRGDNRSVGWFQGLFQLAFHPAWTAKFPQDRQIARRSAAFGGGRRGRETGGGDPPFLTANAVPVPFGFRAAFPCSRVATARFPL